MALEYLKARAAQIDKGSPLPLYYQIKQHLREAVELQHLLPDQVIPSERELMELYGVSRPTVRQATEELLNENYFYRRKGLGTFVAKPKIKQVLPSALSFTERMQREGRVPSSQVISKGLMEGSNELVLGRLVLPPGSPIFQMRRLRLADAEPILLETTHLPLLYFPKLPEVDFNKVSLYQFLRSEYHFEIARMRETLEPVVLNETESKLLGVERGSPAMWVQITIFAQDGRVLEYSQALVRGDRCQYYLELETGENGNGISGRLVHNNLDLNYSTT